MTLLELQYFQVLARNLHYTRTANELNISQPSLSYAINKLEKELGVKLFERKKRTVSLTAYGQAFLPYVEQALSFLDKGSALMKQMVDNAPLVVRLGYFHSISASMIPSLIEGFYQKKENRKIRFQFTETTSYDVLDLIYNLSVDLGFTLHQTDWAESVAIIRQPLYLAVPVGHPLADRPFVSLRDFAREPQIMLEHGANLRSIMDRIYFSDGIVPEIIFEVKECNAALQYVNLGFGIAVLPMVPGMDGTKAIAIPISDKEKDFTRTIYLSYLKNHSLSKEAQKVRDYIIHNSASYN